VSTLSTGIEATTARPVHIAVLGPLEVTAAGRQIRGGLRKARELLAYLALHPDGATGEAISEALWPESGPRYATAQRNLALRKAREMLRTATGLSQPMFIILASERYRLDPALIDVDLWRFEAALDQARTTAGESTQLAVLQQAAALYHGPLVDGAAYDWAERYAEPARRRAVDALARIAEILQPTDPEQSLTTLEAALAHDPYNEAVYQKIMHIQAALGRPDAARRTLRLLETRLAALGLAPDPATRQAAAGATGNQAGHPSPRRS
jgi:DNA-binding SARP family transcriptional activator